MGDILSQAEIDALLKSFESDDGPSIPSMGVTTKEAKLYNFANPSKFSKEHLRAFELIFDNYARMASSFLTGYLRTSVNMGVVGTEQVVYSDFSYSLVNPVIISAVDFAPLKGSIVLELSASVGYTIIDRILGGPGYPVGLLRDFTEIEKILLHRVMNQMLSFFNESWKDVYDIRPTLTSLETNTQFAQMIAPSEITALITMQIKVGSVEGFFNICIPHLLIEPILDNISTKHWYASEREVDEKDVKKLAERLEKTAVPLRVVLGKTNILVSDFVGLQPGDTIPLDSYVNSDVEVYIGNILKFRAKPGTSRGKNAVQISNIIEKEEL